MFGKLKDLLIQPDVPKPQSSSVAKQAVATPEAEALPKKEAETDQMEAKIAEVLNKALLDKALDGYDYLKFYEAQTALEEVIPDEATRFKATFKTVKAMVTKAKLVETAGHYIGVLDESKKDFLNTEAVEQRKIAGTEKDSRALEDSIAAAQKQIEDLQKAIAVDQENLQVLSAKIQDNRRKAERTKQAFTAVCDGMQAKIKQDIEKINKFLE